MAGFRWVALLRGINVGGKNLIRMEALRGAFEELGYSEVSSYIASGNVLFSAPRQKRAELAAHLEEELSTRFEVALKVVVLDARGLHAVIGSAPDGFGGPDHYCDAIFARPPLSAARLFRAFETREGIDECWAGPGCVYYARLAERRSGSRMGQIANKPEYKQLTIRSWKTVLKLAELIEG